MCDAGSESPILTDDLLGVDLWHGRFVAQALMRLFEKSDLPSREVPRGGSCQEGCCRSCAAWAKARAVLCRHLFIVDPKSGPAQPLQERTRDGQRAPSALSLMNKWPSMYGSQARCLLLAATSSRWFDFRAPPGQHRATPECHNEPPNELCSGAASTAAVGTAGRCTELLGPPYGCS